MRLSTVFISSTFVLAGTSAAFPVEAEDMLVARFADPDFLSEVEARAYDEEPELYVHGGAISTNNYKTLSRHRRSFYEPPRYEFTRRDFPGAWPVENTEPARPRVTFASDTNGPRRSSSVGPPTSTESSRNGFRASISNVFLRPCAAGSSLCNKFRNRRSFDELSQSELTRRHEWEPVPDSPRVHWTPDTVDTAPTRPRRPLTPVPRSPDGNGIGNGWHSQYSHHPRSFSEPPSSELTRRHWDLPVPDSPPRGVHWSPDTVDTPDRPRRPPTPVPGRPYSPSSPTGNGNGNGNGWHPQRHHPRSFFDLD